jgi:RHS repeat-associated protein
MPGGGRVGWTSAPAQPAGMGAWMWRGWGGVRLLGERLDLRGWVGGEGGAAAARGSGILLVASSRGSGAALKFQADIAAVGARRMPGRHRRGGGARRGRGSERAARGRVERREAGRAAAAGVYDVRWDINAVSAVTWADYSHYPDIWMGRGVLSHVGNRFGYAGYQHAPELAGAKWHVRNRVLDSITGVWNRRDPLGYIDGMNLYQYVRGMALAGVDPMGLASRACVAQDQAQPSVVPWWWYEGPIYTPPAIPSGRRTPDPGGEIDPCEVARGPLGDGHAGGVICHRGRKVSCVWWTPPPNHPAPAAVARCILEHEDDHHQDVTCAGCPRGYICRPPYNNITAAGGRVPSLRSGRRMPAPEARCLW